MDAKKLYAQLEKDFIKPGLSDDWAGYMQEVSDFICDNFKKRSMGLVCDNASEIKRVYTAVFPSDEVMKKILKKGEKDILLFVHHPSIWDIRKAPNVFQQMDKKLLERFRENRISVYNLHVPLDNYSAYSTSYTLAKALGLKDLKPCTPYFGGLAGVVGKTALTLDELRGKFEKKVGHRVSLYAYGGEIKDGLVAIAAGGGNQVEALQEIKEKGVHTFITGIAARNSHSEPAHKYAEKNRINILGGSHYSTEVFACVEMCKYFKKLGLPCKFIKDTPVLEDM